MERCERGRIGLPAKELTWQTRVRGFESPLLRMMLLGKPGAFFMDNSLFNKKLSKRYFSTRSPRKTVWLPFWLPFFKNNCRKNISTEKLYLSLSDKEKHHILSIFQLFPGTPSISFGFKALSFIIYSRRQNLCL